MQGLQRLPVRGVGLLVEDAFGLHVLVRLRDEHVPVVIELVQQFGANALVRDRVDRPACDRAVIEHGTSRRYAPACVRQAVWALAIDRRVVCVVNAEVGVFARELRRHVVDVATAAVVIDDRAHGHLVRNQRQIQHRGQICIWIAVGGHAVAGIENRLYLVELRGVSDVADHTRFGASAKQRALRALKNLNAADINDVDVEVTRRQLHRLIVEVYRDIREIAR